MGKNLFRSSPPPEKQSAHQSLAESAVQECMSNINTVISKWTSSSSDEFLFSTNSRREARSSLKPLNVCRAPCTVWFPSTPPRRSSCTPRVEREPGLPRPRKRLCTVVLQIAKI
ncbi:hypothetical protein Bca52824_022570 [Brassica carinata]|uniref:Uncharacterized protein n=1 Tax=Brassica carinata TaxID=52824 RepID=A0A8X7VG98_BRACI|nr:hypothetical protein Bca52824_022570 [Brassica carinata]